MPADKRLAIQADLAWTGYYEGPGGGNFDDQRVIDAVKLFQKANNDQETSILTDEDRARLAAAAEPHRQAVGWRVIDDTATGAHFGIPEKLVSPLGPSRIGSRWSSGHGQIQIYAFALSDASLPVLFERDKTAPRGRSVESSTLAPNSFVMSGTQGLKYFVARAESSGSHIRGITILYDQATAGIMAPVALAIANSFQGFPDPTAALPLDRERAVVYGTATVVDTSGDLITTRQVTADCNAITIPGYGHAARIADDGASDLALIRLYGAQNLVPVELAGGSQGDDLAIVGIADPAAQQGSDAVTRIAVHRDEQNLEPVPKAGFSGAAAIDAQGRFSGIAVLRSSIDAGSGSVTRQAAVV
ncbi:MAG: serine protease, partial [Xanthobacteraceae bacterium]